MEARAEPLVLVVDDDADVLTVCASALRQAGCRTVCATDGTTARELAQERQPDLVLSAVDIPGMDGYELVRELRASARTSSICVVLMTGSKVAEEDIVRGFEQGADEYIVKPFNAREFVSRVRKLLEPKRT